MGKSTNGKQIVQFIRGYVYSAATAGAGAGEEAAYLDVAVAGITDYTKCTIDFEGGAGITTGEQWAFGKFITTSSQTKGITARLTSNTNLRLSVPHSAAVVTGYIGCRYTITETR